MSLVPPPPASKINHGVSIYKLEYLDNMYI